MVSINERKFQKYRNRGPDYHWYQISKSNILKYNSFVHARYTIIINYLQMILNSHYKKNEKTIKILDMGCGDGVLLYLISKKIKNTKFVLYGIDQNNNSIHIALKKFHEKNVKSKYSFKVENVYNTLFDDRNFDIIISSDVIEHLKNPEKFIKEAKRLMKPKAFLIIGTPIRYTEKPSDAEHVNEYFPMEFENLLKKYFTKIELFKRFNLLHFLLYDNKRIYRYLFKLYSIFGLNPFLRKIKNKNNLFSYMFSVCEK